MEWRLGTPRKDMGPVEVLWDRDGASPKKGHGTSGSIMGMEMGYPLERTWDQYKYYGMEMGYAPQVWTD